MKGRVERKRERKRFYEPVHSPNGCNSQGWSMLKPTARSLLPVSHVIAGDQALGASYAASPGTSPRSWSESGVARA